VNSYETQDAQDLLDDLAGDISGWAEEKGFWPLLDTDDPSTVRWLDAAEKSQKLLLIVTELAECCEGIRKPVEASIEGFTNEEEEIADALIRLLDYAGHYHLRIGAALAAKMAVNEGRPFRHGKAF
jgi:hypothetical protein